MIRIFLGPRFIRSAHSLAPESHAKVNDALISAAEHFGNPRRHSALGLRKLGSGLWECRIDIQLRVILLSEGDCLRAYDIMNHDEVRAWLKRHR